MGISPNKMVGDTWIGQSWHTDCIATARYFEEKQRQALERGDSVAAEQHEAWGRIHLLQTVRLDNGQPKRIVSDKEAARLRAADDEARLAREDAEHLAALKKKLGITPRSNGSAYRPYPGGLPTLGRDR
ncbi:hypothetical protein ACF1GW_38800 [Streptomyces achromogenes]|uniref:hypothetical protein n=1 Tax=Streptomyces achromogenes TaxID=67255 RepID=UPI0036FC39D9